MPAWRLSENGDGSGFDLTIELPPDPRCQCGLVPTVFTLSLSPAQTEHLRNALSVAVEARELRFT